MALLEPPAQVRPVGEATLVCHPGRRLSLGQQPPRAGETHLRVIALGRAPDGSPVPAEKRRPVRARAVEADLKWLRWTLNWGTRWSDQAGRYLPRENAVCGYGILSERTRVALSRVKTTHGAIRSPEDTDKEGREWTAPITLAVRAALDRVLSERPGIGAAYIFPAPGNPAQPTTKDLARK